MTATPNDLRKRATRLRRGVGQLGVIESILDAADGPWLGVMDADGRGTAELRMHLAGRYRLTAVVTSAGKLSMVQMHAPEVGERVISGKPALRQGWDETVTMPKQPDWLDYVIDWVGAASADVDRRTVITWQLQGADRRLAAMDDTLEGMRASLAEREQLRDELAAEIDLLRSEFDSLPERRADTADLPVVGVDLPGTPGSDLPTEPGTVAPELPSDDRLTEPHTAAPDLPVVDRVGELGAGLHEVSGAPEASEPGNSTDDQFPGANTVPHENPDVMSDPADISRVDANAQI
ncbi:hypothetical protein K7711_23780 [Nocardia sp. CA2R105]|uniref:hypothetical protein n=1 Tax=Nocardia coffeae TaxID=2873381 RepID=UPI001CA78B4C|nr:hypothetical protein [Nocardia coffeae]MBY8859509.1 hypothetical protein [Nocardia coffeae]